MHIYHREKAGRPIRVVWTLEEAGLPYDMTVLTKEQAEAEEHRDRHPLGRVPVLVTEDATIFESTGLCLHVAELAPEASLIPPSGTTDRGLVYQWMFFAMTDIEPPLLDVFRYAESAPEVAAAGRERAQAAIDALERALDGHEYLVAERFTVADIVVSEVARLAGRAGAADLGPNVTAYIARLKERPARARAQEQVARSAG